MFVGPYGHSLCQRTTNVRWAICAPELINQNTLDFGQLNSNSGPSIQTVLMRLQMRFKKNTRGARGTALLWAGNGPRKHPAAERLSNTLEATRNMSFGIRFPLESNKKCFSKGSCGNLSLSWIRICSIIPRKSFAHTQIVCTDLGPLSVPLW